MIGSHYNLSILSVIGHKRARPHGLNGSPRIDSLSLTPKNFVVLLTLFFVLGDELPIDLMISVY